MYITSMLPLMLLLFLNFVGFHGHFGDVRFLHKGGYEQEEVDTVGGHTDHTEVLQDEVQDVSQVD